MLKDELKKFVDSNNEVKGIIVVDRIKAEPIEFAIKENISLSDINSISKIAVDIIKIYENTKAGGDLVTVLLNSKEYTIIIDDYQNNNKVLVLLFKPNFIVIKFVDESAKILQNVINIIKSSQDKISAKSSLRDKGS